MSGVLTLVIIGVPTLLWAAVSGALQWQTVAPILVGIALFGGLAAIYMVTVVGIRRRERQKIAEALAVEEYVSDTLPDPKLLSTLTAEQRSRLIASISDAGRAQVIGAMRLARLQTRLATLASAVATVGGALAGAWATNLLAELIKAAP